MAPLIGVQHAAHGALHESAVGLTLFGVGEAPLCGLAMKRSGPAPELTCDQGEGGAGEALSEAAGEALSEASRVGALESTPPSSARRIGIVQDGVESTPPSEYRKPPSNAWTSPSEHKESSFLRLPAHPSAYSHILPSQAESSGNPRGAKGRGARSFAALRRYPSGDSDCIFLAQNSARLVRPTSNYARLRALLMETLIAYSARVKNRTDFSTASMPLNQPGTNSSSGPAALAAPVRGGSVGPRCRRGRNATERGITKSLIGERFKTVRYSYNDLRTTRVVVARLNMPSVSAPQ